MDDVTVLQKRLAREKGARVQAEQLLEEKSREVFDANQELDQKVKQLNVILSNLIEVILITDLKGVVKTSNAQAKKKLLEFQIFVILIMFSENRLDNFTNFSTCLKYAVPSGVTGMRMLVVCEVALGNCYDCTTVQPGLTAPPSGYHSCHGVKMTEDNETDFPVCSYNVLWM